MPRNKARSKYGARPTTVDGIRFHSAKEARRYGELRLLLKAGEIRSLELQPRFALSAWTAGRTEAGEVLGAYVGDFQYQEPLMSGDRDLWRLVVEDVKGFKTPLYRWKKKHVEAQYGIVIREI